jgi:hypothetical protein
MAVALSDDATLAVTAYVTVSRGRAEVLPEALAALPVVAVSFFRCRYFLLADSADSAAAG